MSPRLVCLLSLLALGACTNLFGQSAGEYNKVWLTPDTKGLVTTADVRTVLHRTANGRDTVCTEPPPDVAKALSTAEALALNVPLHGATVGVNADARTAEALAQLSGRVPGLLALRDGLFRACEAYANGIIGSASYYLILSRYGEILTTVILGDAVNDPSQTTNITVQSPVLPPAALTAPAKPSQSSNETPANTESPGGVGRNGALAPEGPAVVASVETEAGGRRPVRQAVYQMAQAGEPAQGAATPPSVSAAQKRAEAAKAAQAKSDAALAKTTADLKEAQKALADLKAANNAASTLEKIQHNYLNLTTVAPLLLACIGEYDPSQQPFDQVSATRQHPVLTIPFCRNFLKQLTYYELLGRLYNLRHGLLVDSTNKIGAEALPPFPPPPPLTPDP